MYSKLITLIIFLFVNNVSVATNEAVDYSFQNTETHLHHRPYSNLGGMRWKDGIVKWWYNPSGQKVGTTAQVVQSINVAASKWEAVSGLNFIYMGTTNDALSNRNDNKFVIGWLTQSTFNTRFGAFAGYARLWWNQGCSIQLKECRVIL